MMTTRTKTKTPSEPHWRSETATVLTVTVAGLIVWDVVADIEGGNEATISDVVYTSVRKNPLLPLLMGIAIGHWFVRQTTRCADCSRLLSAP